MRCHTVITAIYITLLSCNPFYRGAMEQSSHMSGDVASWPPHRTATGLKQDRVTYRAVHKGYKLTIEVISRLLKDNEVYCTLATTGWSNR